MKKHGVFIPEVVDTDPWTDRRGGNSLCGPCPHLGDCNRCPHAALGQDAGASLAVQVDAAGIAEQINTWFAEPSPFLGLSWGSVLVFGLGAWSLFGSRAKLR